MSVLGIDDWLLAVNSFLGRRQGGSASHCRVLRLAHVSIPTFVCDFTVCARVWIVERCWNTAAVGRTLLSTKYILFDICIFDMIYSTSCRTRGVLLLHW